MQANKYGATSKTQKQKKTKKTNFCLICLVLTVTVVFTHGIFNVPCPSVPDISVSVKRVFISLMSSKKTWQILIDLAEGHF